VTVQPWNKDNSAWRYWATLGVVYLEQVVSCRHTCQSISGCSRVRPACNGWLDAPAAWNVTYNITCVTLAGKNLSWWLGVHGGWFIAGLLPLCILLFLCLCCIMFHLELHKYISFSIHISYYLFIIVLTADIIEHFKSDKVEGYCLCCLASN